MTRWIIISIRDVFSYSILQRTHVSFSSKCTGIVSFDINDHPMESWWKYLTEISLYLWVTPLPVADSCIVSAASYSWWRHQMETFSESLAHRSPVNSPHKGQWRGALIFPLIYAWINAWSNNREAGDLRRHFPRHWPNGHQWIPRTKASDAGLWCFLWSTPE